jgi:hypothetical protein
MFDDNYTSPPATGPAEGTAETPEGPGATSPLVEAIRTSLNAKIERLLRRPIIARIGSGMAPPVDDGLPELLRVWDALEDAAPSSRGDAGSAHWIQDTDGACRFAISVDYDDLWRGAEKEVLENVQGTVEQHVQFLTDEQRRLLVASPREFAALRPGPETIELVSFRAEPVGGCQRVVELTVAAAPAGRDHVRHVAIVPNLIPLQRQLSALATIEGAAGVPEMAALRVLLGLDTAAALPAVDASMAPGHAEGLDEFQAECVHKALTTPHFAVIKGPPGSGKTTVITNIIRRALERGDRVLVVSPTHVAVDNVVEKLAPRGHAGDVDDLEPRTIPVRYASKDRRLSEGARAYWVGPKRQLRGATIGRRIQDALIASVPIARALFSHVDADAGGHAPISAAVADSHGVICGTPIGILSFEAVAAAAPGSFGLLVVDEVSKMTLPEFLAIAVKARRWVLVGDPEQLPPYNSAEENADTLDDLVEPILDLACSTAAVLEKTRSADRPTLRLVVVSSDPDRAMRALRTHVRAAQLTDLPPLSSVGEARSVGVVVCSPEEVQDAVTNLSPARDRDRTHSPGLSGTVEILVERGVAVQRPAFASGARLLDARRRSQVAIFENAFNTYHAQPWSQRAEQPLRLVGLRYALDKYLPSAEGIAEVRGVGLPEAKQLRAAVVAAIAERFAANAVSVYDWLTGVLVDQFDVSPLRELAGVIAPLEPLRAAVRPFVGTLRKQYRMDPSLSLVPRELFYFGEALEDGIPKPGGGCRVRLVQVEADGQGGEDNANEATKILGALEQLSAVHRGKAPPGIMVITPYRVQERRLEELVRTARTRGTLDHVTVDICTLDRCQGREAEYVFISLVRNRATHFLDAPKRWNVALTRAMQGLFIFGDVDAYLREAAAANTRRGGPRPPISILAKVLDAYSRQIRRAGTGRAS